MGYRYSCLREANARGLSGWVRNLQDGRVEAVFQGGQSAVDAAIEWAKAGPPGARVSGVDIQWEAPQNEPPGFRIC